MAKRGRKPKHDLSDISCPNENCPDFGKTGQSNIVSNGTYVSQNGRERRYKCKTCATSFCRKTGTVFEGFRTPEEKVINALKLMAKGITLRKVSQMLDINPDTLRSWLFQLSDHSETVNRLLSKEVGITPEELTNLWNSVKNDALRQRAILWRKKCGWRKGW